MPAGQVTFPALLQQASYYTAAAGKWHLGDYAKRAFHKIVDSGPGGEERWVECLQQRPKDQPFFMWFASHDAHRGWAPDKDAEPHTPQDAVIPPYSIDTPDMRGDVAKYYDEIQRLDRYVGLVVDELRAQGILDDTAIFFMADNGRPFPRCKTRLYDSGIKTPLVIHWPAGMSHREAVCDSLVSAIDIAPTILEIAGLTAPQTVQGISMTPLLSDLTSSIRECAFAEHNWHAQIAHERMVRRGDYVYIRNAHPQLPQICGLDAQCPQRELNSATQEGPQMPERSKVVWRGETRVSSGALQFSSTLVRFDAANAAGRFGVALERNTQARSSRCGVRGIFRREFAWERHPDCRKSAG